MNPDRLKQILQAVADSNCTIEEAMDRLRRWPTEDLGFANVDHHRHVRQGVPEVIFAGSKQPAETVAIAEALVREQAPLLVTRANSETLALLKAAFPAGKTNERASTFSFRPPGADTEGEATDKDGEGCVVVVAAGTSDISVAEEAVETARMLGAAVTPLYDVGVAGLHRLLSRLEILNQANAIVAVAGMEGALPSVVAGLVSVPVIAVPTSVGYGASLGGIAALMGMLTSCASGISVVNIDNGFGGGYAAGLINRGAVHGGVAQVGGK
jgi:pyridinium-3,5-biscarboxylic acid mononucleotide synthase